MYKIKFKNESLLMKIISKILFFNKDFMTKYVTTIFDTIYFPNEENYKLVSSKISLLHEIVHILDFKNKLFMFMYLSPQIFGLLAILGPIFNWWFLLFLILFLPIPSYFRMLAEKRAYTITLYVTYKYCKEKGYKFDIDDVIEFIINNFKSSGYYFMWPFTNNLEKYYYEVFDKIKNGEKPYLNKEIYDLVDIEYDKIFNS